MESKLSLVLASLTLAVLLPAQESDAQTPYGVRGGPFNFGNQASFEYDYNSFSYNPYGYQPSVVRSEVEYEQIIPTFRSNGYNPAYSGAVYPGTGYQGYAGEGYLGFSEYPFIGYQGNPGAVYPGTGFFGYPAGTSYQGYAGDRYPGSSFSPYPFTDYQGAVNTFPGYPGFPIGRFPSTTPVNY